MQFYEGMIHLDDATIDALLDLAGVTDVVGRAFLDWGRGSAATTQRVRASTADAMVSAMAAVVPPFTGGKIYATRNGKFTFLNVLFDFDGRMLCTLDGDALTALRTPATCALAIRSLATPTAITTAALFGAGRQGWRHLEMLRSELPRLECVRIVDINPSAAEAMVTRARQVGIPAEVAIDGDAAVAGAGVVITITQSTEPLFSATALAGSALICAVGATKYDRCEIGADVVAKCATVVCDDVVGSRAECGDLIQAHRAGRFDWERAIELHAILAGSVALPTPRSGPVLFETQGVALQDVAAAGLAWQRYTNERTTP